MRTRKQKIHGKIFVVPSHVVRLDDKGTHGWQLRYGDDSKYFADPSDDRAGTAESLRLATLELHKRVAKLPAPTGLRTTAQARKANDLPVGISGPKLVQRADRNSIQYYLQVTYPVLNGKPANRNIYIATENTLTKEKFDAALAKAIEMRTEQVRKFKTQTTRQARKDVAALV